MITYWSLRLKVKKKKKKKKKKKVTSGNDEQPGSQLTCPSGWYFEMKIEEIRTILFQFNSYIA